MKPLFEQERKLLETELSIEVPVDSFLSQTRIIAAGKTLFQFGVRDGKLYLRRALSQKATRRNYSSSEEYWGIVIEANRRVVEQLESQSRELITDVAGRKEYKSHKKLVLFSGGKDSAIAALLVTETIGEVPLLYADTTIESPASIQYAKDFASTYNLELVIESPNQTFFDLCSKLEPPSKFIRWCCTALKANPVSRFIKSQGPALCFDGIRACESRSRREYPLVQPNRKLAGQITVHPLLEGWSTLAIWLYTMDSKIPINPEYYRGQHRVGCIVCPFNALWDEFLSKHYHPTVWEKFTRALQEYAYEHQLPEDWITSGEWKYRRPSSSISVAAIERRCPILSRNGKEASKIVLGYPLPIDVTIEFLKPFGQLSKEQHEYTFQSLGGEYSIILNLERAPYSIYISTIPSVNGRIRRLVIKQLKKALNCVRCGGCSGICPNNALEVSDTGHFHIDERRCSHCLRCVTDNFVERGCLALMSKSDIQVVSKL
jgi:phosphoadenosine phosphosulfate reductase